MTMRKRIVPLLILLISFWLLLTWCDFNSSEPSSPSQENLNEYTWKYLALYPFEIIKQEKPDYSWMTVQKLYNDPSILKDSWTNYWKNIYFLNIEYQIKTWESYESEYYQIQPQNEPIYLNDFSEKNTWIIRVDWNILLTGYLESKLRPELAIRETDEEINSSPKVENRYIKYINKKWEEKTLNLWYIKKNIFTAWNDWEKDALISTYFSPRIDLISHFGDNDINLYDFVNDWKIHTFHIIISRPHFEWDEYFGLSAIKERYLIE